jgi:hypothetical protein
VDPMTRDDDDDAVCGRQTPLSERGVLQRSSGDLRYDHNHQHLVEYKAHSIL